MMLSDEKEDDVVVPVASSDGSMMHAPLSLQHLQALGSLKPIMGSPLQDNSAPKPPSQMEDEEDETATGRDSPVSALPSPHTVTVLEMDFKDHHNIIIFDWDDTLLPSSYLASQGLHLDSPPEHTESLRDQLTKLENTVASVLNLAMSFGRVCIITNAETGWVELSARKFFPNLAPLLSKIPVMSARSTFEPSYPNSPLQWKLYAFKHHISQLVNSNNSLANNSGSGGGSGGGVGGSSSSSNTNTNTGGGSSTGTVRLHVMSFGDSHVEREAVFMATSELSNSTTKSIKFAERPSLAILHRQLQLLTSCFKTIYAHPKCLDEGLFVHQM